ESLLKMEKELKDAQLSWKDMPFPVITFGANIDIEETEEQLANELVKANKVTRKIIYKY
ncbi:unnamed protein product, partial [Caenorhabditis brenneri]